MCACDLDDLNPRLARDLRGPLDASQDWQTLFTAVETAITRHIARARENSPGTTWAWQTLRAADGSCAIGPIAQALSLSHKQLIAQFKQGIGLPPKMVARVLRFNKVLESVAHFQGWASIAQHCGYADQAHLIRDFNEFAGGTPAELIRLKAGFTLRN